MPTVARGDGEAVWEERGLGFSFIKKEITALKNETWEGFIKTKLAIYENQHTAPDTLTLSYYFLNFYVYFIYY